MHTIGCLPIGGTKVIYYILYGALILSDLHKVSLVHPLLFDSFEQCNDSIIINQVNHLSKEGILELKCIKVDLNREKK